uniref:Uncharacterized protein n=1 Tax=Arundo donax TaxID=35708 RepID=A0A0A9HPF8_ARUDO
MLVSCREVEHVFSGYGNASSGIFVMSDKSYSYS